MYLSAERAGAVRCAEKSPLYLSVFSLYLSFPPSKHSHCYSFCSFSFLPCWWHLTSLYFHLPFHSWSLLLLKALFPFTSAPVNRLLKNLFFSFTSYSNANEMVAHYYWIILGRLSASLQFSSSYLLPSLSLFSFLCVYSCCHSCELLLLLCVGDESSESAND